MNPGGDFSKRKSKTLYSSNGNIISLDNEGPNNPLGTGLVLIDCKKILQKNEKSLISGGEISRLKYLHDQHYYPL